MSKSNSSGILNSIYLYIKLETSLFDMSVIRIKDIYN